MASLNDIVTMDRLPAMPTVLARALPLLTDPESDWKQLERLLRQDEAVTVAVLRLANSAKYGTPGRHFDLRAAMSRLGRDVLRRCVLEQQVSGIVSGDVAAFGLQRGALWRSALGGALASEALATRHAPKEASIAFVCGLLRDIGKLAINVAYGGSYFSLVKARSVEGRPFIDAERAALGFDHAQVGAALARRWKLPDRVVRAIETHHAPPPPGPGHDIVFDIVHAADVICLWTGLGVGIDGMDYRLADHVRQSLHFDRREAERDIAMVWTKVQEAEAELSVSTMKGAA